ncbi:MAG: hypothetical protein COA74_14060 [Gammaproteobacteria bacterium]|nr:MAG: hypothetical protein COA74_14060 [Gammaproteobacteria bacterium]
MNKSINFLNLVALAIIISSCTPKLTSIEDKADEEVSMRYKILKDVSYGSHEEQVMDIYLSKDAKSLRPKNFTIVFLHGGGYYVSDKSKEERYIEPYLKKGLNVVNMNYRLKQGISPATEDLKNALNFLYSQNATYKLDLGHVILTGFSAGAHIASNVGTSQNNSENPFELNSNIRIAGVINFGGIVDGLDVVEKIFVDHEVEIMRTIGNAFFPAINGYTPNETISIYEPITYFDRDDPPLFLWHGGKDDQIPPATFEKFVRLLNKDKQKNIVIFNPEAEHSPTNEVLEDSYHKIFVFLDNL